MDQAIIPECFVDTNLTETLSPPQKQYNHQKGCTVVTKVMRENFSDRFAVGIIDKDKKEVNYLNEFFEAIKIGSLVLHKHVQKHHYIIQVTPAMEMFILNNAAAVGINLGNFELPSDLDTLRKLSKTTNTKNDPKFKKLFKAISNAGAEDFIRLGKWITYLKTYQYTVDINALRNL